jgi:hypothetical protein
MPSYILVAYILVLFFSKEFNSKTIIIGLTIILITGILIKQRYFLELLTIQSGIYPFSIRNTLQWLIWSNSFAPSYFSATYGIYLATFYFGSFWIDGKYQNLIHTFSKINNNKLSI